MRAPDAPNARTATPPATAAATKPAATPRALASGPKKSTGVAVTIGIVVVLLIGGAGYVYFQDPFGLFNRTAAPVAETPPLQPAPTEPVAVQTPEPAPVTPPTTPEPAPTETAVAPVSVPAKPAEPPPPPPPDPVVEKIVAGYVIAGARADADGGMVMIGGSVHRRGSVVHAESGLTFMGFEGGKLTFRDRNGATYQRKF